MNEQAVNGKQAVNGNDEGTASPPEDAPVATRRRRRLPELEPETLTGSGETRLYRVFEEQVLLVQISDGNTQSIAALVPVDQVAAVNDKDAIKAAISDDRAGTFVAIAERYYNPRTRELKTVTQESWT